MQSKRYFFNVCVCLTTFLIGLSCRGFRQAPLGLHGIYSRNTDSLYKTNNLCKDSVLSILKKQNLIVKKEILHEYDQPWDSLRYLISNIPCGSEHIEAYIEFQDKKSTNTSFRILWFNSIPINDDSLYVEKTKRYYMCFEKILRNSRITRE